MQCWWIFDFETDYCVFNLVVGRKILWYFKLKILGGL
jgi:hypothetical protein